MCFKWRNIYVYVYFNDDIIVITFINIIISFNEES